MLTDSSLLPQVAARQIDKHILEARLSSGEVQKLRAVFFDSIEQRWDGQVRLAYGKADQTIVMADRLHAGQHSPRIESSTVAGVAAGLELHHVVPAQALDQLGGRAFGNDLAVVDDR